MVHGVPDGKDDFKHMTLKWNGELVVKKRLEPLLDTEVAVPEENKKWQMDLDTLQQHLYDIRRFHQIHAEYFKPDVVYKYNQDGKEYRYNFNKKKVGPQT